MKKNKQLIVLISAKISAICGIGTGKCLGIGIGATLITGNERKE